MPKLGRWTRAGAITTMSAAPSSILDKTLYSVSVFREGVCVWADGVCVWADGVCVCTLVLVSVIETDFASQSLNCFNDQSLNFRTA